MRKKLGLTQKEFAERVEGKIDYTYIGKIERGQQYPSLKILEKIGKTFSTPLSYFFEDHSFLKFLDLLPSELKDLLQDKKRQDLLKMSRGLNPRGLGAVMQIMKILTQEKPLEGLHMPEPGPDYLSMEEKKKED